MNAVLITGAAKRIGKALAQAFAEQGFAVALHYYQSEQEAEALAEALTHSHKIKTCLIKADLETIGLDDAANLIQQASDGLGTKLNCLINNASLFERDSAKNIDPMLFQAHLHINLRAPLFLSNAFAQHQKEQGNIIMLLDQKVLRANPHFFSYTLSKIALWEATKLLAQALAPALRVNAIGPGSALPNHWQTPEAFQQHAQATPLKYSATIEEIAQTALWLVAQPSITGQFLALDGGKHLSAQP